MNETPHGNGTNEAETTLIRNGVVIDGSGSERCRADVLVRGDRIAAVGDLGGQPAPACVIDARGAIVAPGFIDAHTHDDRALLSTPDMSPKISQGVTTVVTGNCGVSLAPLVGRDPPPPLTLLGDRHWYRFPSVDAYARAVEASPPAVNALMLVGHSTLRVAVMEDLTAPATPTEIGRMAVLLDEALETGCVGLSTGLAYPTASAAPTDEVAVLAERLAAHGGLYATHMRDEGDRLVESVDETLEIGRRAGVPVVISHHKAAGRHNWGKTRETLVRIDAAARRQKVDFDVYPYAATSTVLLPEFVARAERVMMSWSIPHPEMAGRDLDGICHEWGCTVEEAIERLLPAGAIYFMLDENEVQSVLRFPRAMIGSDGLPHDRFPHPRLWGTFPRVLGHYARELGLFSLEQAVHRMTGLTASVYGLAERGAIRVGAYADLVIFDAERVIDRADYARPCEPAAGIDLVMVNGQTVWTAGAWTGRCPGRLLRRVGGSG